MFVDRNIYTYLFIIHYLSSAIVYNQATISAASAAAADLYTIFRCVHATLKEGMSVGQSVCRSVCPWVGNHFLDASTHLYKRLCPSVRLSVRGSDVCQNQDFK